MDETPTRGGNHEQGLFLLDISLTQLEKRREIYLCPKLKTGGMEAFQAAISKGMRDKKCKPCQSVGEHKPWALRTAESHRQTLKAIIGTGTGDRLHGACRGPVGVISYSVLGRGAPPSPKTQSQRGMNY